MPTDPAPSRQYKGPGSPKPRGNIVVLVAIAAIAIGLYLVVSAIQEHNAVQNCIDSGRRDCVAIPAGSSP